MSNGNKGKILNQITDKWTLSGYSNLADEIDKILKYGTSSSEMIGEIAGLIRSTRETNPDAFKIVEEEYYQFLDLYPNLGLFR